jgi:DNA-binding response OmpR family regulator/nitrogen-specific signal transduction histidine kinase
MREARLRAELAEEHTHVLEALDLAKSRFFANISHEFRTPLTLLLGPLQEALDKEQPPERLVHQVPLMHRNAARLLRLVNQLLDLSKLEAGSMHLHTRRLDLTAFVRELVLAFAPQAERAGLTLIFDTGPVAIEGSADPDKLEKIVTNLLSNAIKFTMRGGKIRVELTATDDGAGFILTVSDTGMGIPADELPHVFDRFHQVDSTTTREQEGTGIGLALVRELVELHRGTIAVESKRGFGTSFTVRMPLDAQGVDPHPATTATDEETPHGPSSAAALEIASLQAVASGPDETTHVAQPAYGAEAAQAARDRMAEGTVLVVDDNADVRAFVCGNLAAHFHMMEAGDGEAGLALIRQHHPDLVLCDVMMPKLDGYAVCRAVKADHELRHIPVILLTAKAEEADRIYGLEGGADDYLTKPFSMRELEVRVTNLILSRRDLRSQSSGMLRMPLADVIIPSGEEAFMQEVLEAMNRHLGDNNFSIDWLADEVSLSRRQVERRVKTLTKQTPTELMQHMRLERAAHILKARPGSIAEVAYAVGFKSPAHFSVAFRKAYGHTPSDHFGNTT